eukprot:5548183-Pyramimonas_sp.AAC.2
MGRGRHAGAATGALHRAPIGSRRVCRVCRIGYGYAVRTESLGPSAELPVGNEAFEGCAEADTGTPCGLRHWGLWATFL